MRALTFTRTIGAGAFGTVYLAELASGQGFRRQVAVKVLSGDRPESEMFLSRIRDEARLLGLLQDDTILKVLDMVRVAGRDAVIMEYVEGLDLDRLLETGEAPSPRAVAELGAEVAGGLARAHRAVHPATGEPLNVIHRDVKPANIMITRAGGVKLLDFGVARARFDARESHTGQLVLGTLNYMAPEYIVTGEVSPAADVYGLGLSIWQIATGSAYGQPKVRQDAHERRLAERLAQLDPALGALRPVLERMLAWDPHARPTGAEAEQLLQEVADRLSGASLRSWARQAVAAALDQQAAAPDKAGLVGQTCELDDPGERPPEELAPVEPFSVPDPSASAVYTGADAQPPAAVAALADPRDDPARGLDNRRETRESVSTSRADAAPSTPQRPPPAPPPRPAQAASPAPAPAAAPAAAGGSPIPLGTVIAGAGAGLLLGMVVVGLVAALVLS